MRLDGRKVLITGGGAGIGRALAHEAARRGAVVLICGRNAGTLRETAAAAPERIATVVADVTRPAGRAAVLRAAHLRGGLDILVNNAGRQTVGPLSELADDDLQAMLATNLAAPAALIRDCLPLLRASAAARIVNVGSMFGNIAFPLFAVYSASKFGLRGLSDALRRELADDGIVVTYLAPRATKTATSARSAHLVKPFAMTLDEPEAVATRAWDGVLAGRRTVYPGLAERFFALLQAITPGPIDGTLVRQLRAATQDRPAATPIVRPASNSR